MAVRLPLPDSVRVSDEVEMVWSPPFTEIEVKRNCREAPPLNLPSDFASTTVPEAAAPEGIAVLPSTATGLARVAVKVCPAELIFDPTDCPRRTVSTVPAGTTIGFGASGFILDIFDIVEPAPADAPEPAAPESLFELGDALLSLEFEAVESAGLLLQPSIKSER
jgi:hypothetical protein